MAESRIITNTISSYLTHLDPNSKNSALALLIFNWFFSNISRQRSSFPSNIFRCFLSTKTTSYAYKKRIFQIDKMSVRHVSSIAWTRTPPYFSSARRTTARPEIRGYTTVLSHRTSSESSRVGIRLTTIKNLYLFCAQKL